MKKVLFIADMFAEHLIGGAELNDDVLYNHLCENGFDVRKIASSNVTDDVIINNDLFIVGNFVALPENLKEVLMLKKYIIYEHDHKYVSNRNPGAFENFNIPSQYIINRDFYAKAHKVIVLSKVCKEVMEKNLQIDNVVSIGCSLWSDEKLELIESLQKTEKNNKFCIINSNNPIKGTAQAIKYCEDNNIDYDLIGPLPEKELLETMAKYKGFVFFPQVLETLSRIVVEAKMLNCGVLTTPQLIGAASEEWFSSSGTKLIETIRNKKLESFSIFESALLDKGDITVILNCYRRPQYLEQQIKAIREQTIKPKEIWLWVNYHEDNSDIDFSKYDVDKVIKNDFNWKFYGRFSIAMMARTKYIALFDDDTIPGSNWFYNCHETSKQNKGILVGNGISVTSEKYVGRTLVGWTTQNEETIEVDLGGHAWFFESEWLKYLWMEKPFTLENGEDIQFSYCAQKYGNIKTFCPRHPASDITLHSSLDGYQMGVDDVASSRTRKHAQFYAQRDACVKNAILHGWQPTYMRKEKNI